MIIFCLIPTRSKMLSESLKPSLIWMKVSSWNTDEETSYQRVTLATWRWNRKGEKFNVYTPTINILLLEFFTNILDIQKKRNKCRKVNQNKFSSFRLGMSACPQSGTFIDQQSLETLPDGNTNHHRAALLKFILPWIHAKTRIIKTLWVSSK